MLASGAKRPAFEKRLLSLQAVNQAIQKRAEDQTEDKNKEIKKRIHFFILP